MLPCGVFNTTYEKDISIVRTKTHWALLTGFVVLVLLAPQFLGPKLLDILNYMAIDLIAVLGLNIVIGYCGQIALAQSAFMAVGGYTSAILYGEFGLPFFACLLAAGLSSGLAGLVFGSPAVRIKGFYLAMATLAAQFIIIWIIDHTPAISGGYLGMEVGKPAIFGISLESIKANSYLIFPITLVMVYLHKNLGRSRTGRAFMAIRDNDIAAEVMGVGLSRNKLLAFFLSAFYAGVAGCLWAHYVGRLHPEAFGLMDSIWYVGFLVVGGMGSTMGPIFGTVFLVSLTEFVRFISPILAGSFTGLSGSIFAASAQLIFGLIVVLFVVFEPRGINHRWEIFKNYYRLHPYSY